MPITTEQIAPCAFSISGMLITMMPISLSSTIERNCYRLFVPRRFASSIIMSFVESVIAFYVFVFLRYLEEYVVKRYISSLLSVPGPNALN